MPLVGGTASHAKACVALVATGVGNEVFVLYRSFLERLITFYYLQACDQEEYDRYIAYSIHKTYRKMDRTLRVGEKAFTLKYTGSIDLAAHPELAAAVQLFTSARGREMTRWSNTSIETKLAVIESSGVIDTTALIMATGSLYDDCSEAVHATLYGCTFHFGLFQPGAKLEQPHDFLQRHRDNLTLLFFFGSVLLSELAQYCAKKCEANDIAQEAASLERQATELMKKTVRRPDSATAADTKDTAAD
jgi:hypothetical protein